ncbi:MAG: flagellin [Syntrophomonadaceae bacterium]|nr:flagellin [Syntrophomonadaceae bacterium]
MIINHNIAALNTYRQLSTNGANSSKSLEKLSSGLRINKAGDDAAGLAISEKMRGQIRGLDQASTNAQDGISLIQTAEGALNETHSILQRMRELAVQASNDTSTPEDKTKIQDEMNQLRQEIDRIANTTQFNTKTLLNGSLSKTVTDTGAQAANFVDSGYSTTGSTGAGVYTLTVTTAGTQGAVNATAVADTFHASAAADATTAIGISGTLTINNSDISIAATDTMNDVVAKINNLSAKTGVVASTAAGTDTASAAAQYLKLNTVQYGSDQTVQVSGTSANLLALGVTLNGDTSTVISKAGTDAVATLAQGATNYTQISAAGNKITFDNGLTVQGLDGTVGNGNTTTVVVGGESTLNLQIGANEDQSLNISINKMDAAALKVSGSSTTTALNVTSYETAKAAITVIDAAISTVSTERASLGAYQNRLEHTINNLGTSSENLSAAESRVRDVDMAKEMMEFTKTNILSQAATAMLAQANQQPQQVLKLLQ